MSGNPTCALMSNASVLLRSLKRLLEPEFEVVGMCDNTISLLKALDSMEVDVVVVDVDPGLHDFVEHLIARRPGLRLVALGEASPRQVQSLQKAGVSAYVQKLELARDIVAAVRAAHDGETFVSKPPAGEH